MGPTPGKDISFAPTPAEVVLSAPKPSRNGLDTINEGDQSTTSDRGKMLMAAYEQQTQSALLVGEDDADESASDSKEGDGEVTKTEHDVDAAMKQAYGVELKSKKALTQWFLDRRAAKVSAGLQAAARESLRDLRTSVEAIDGAPVPALEQRFSEMFPAAKVSRHCKDLSQPLNDLLTEATGKGFSMHKWHIDGDDTDQLECLNAAKTHLEIKDTLLEIEQARRVLFDTEYPLPQCMITVVWKLSVLWTLAMWFIVIHYAINLEVKPQWASAGLVSNCAAVANERLNMPEDINESWIAQSLPPKWIEGFAFPDHWSMSSRLLVSTLFSIIYNWVILDPIFHMWVVCYKLAGGHGLLRCKCKSYAERERLKRQKNEKWSTFRYYETLDAVLDRMLILARGPGVTPKPLNSGGPKVVET